MVKVYSYDYRAGRTIRAEVISKPSVLFCDIGEIFARECRASCPLSENFRNQVKDFPVEGTEFLSMNSRIPIGCRVRTLKAVCAKGLV